MFCLINEKKSQNLWLEDIILSEQRPKYEEKNVPEYLKKSWKKLHMIHFYMIVVEKNIRHVLKLFNIPD